MEDIRLAFFFLQCKKSGQILRNWSFKNPITKRGSQISFFRIPLFLPKWLPYDIMYAYIIIYCIYYIIYQNIMEHFNNYLNVQGNIYFSNSFSKCVRKTVMGPQSYTIHL